MPIYGRGPRIPPPPKPRQHRPRLTEEEVRLLIQALEEAALSLSEKCEAGVAGYEVRRRLWDLMDLKDRFSLLLKGKTGRPSSKITL